MTTFPKLCYVLPAYRPNEATHFSYLPDFIKLLAQRFDLFLIVERGELPSPDWGYRIAKRPPSAPLRFLAIVFYLLRARWKGYRDAYVHYSFFSAYVASLVGMRVWYWNCGEPWKYRRRWWRERLERLTYQRIHRLVTGTPRCGAAYAERYHLPLEKIVVIPNWIPVEEFRQSVREAQTESLRRKLAIPPSTQVVLFVHRLSRRKGAHYLPPIARVLGGENAVMIVVGDGPSRKVTAQAIEQAGTSDRVRFVGSVAHKDLSAYYAVANVLIMPSDEEGFPHVLLEAMAAHVPFAAFRVGGVPEIVPPQAAPYLVRPADASGFLKALKELLNLPTAERESLTRALGEWVLQYDTSRVIELFPIGRKTNS